MATKVPTSGTLVGHTDVRKVDQDWRLPSLHQQQQRRHKPVYTKTQPEGFEDTMAEELESHLRAVNVNDNVTNVVKDNWKTIGTPLLHEIPTLQSTTPVRRLGWFEHMYNEFAIKGAEVICLKTTVESAYEIPDEIVRYTYLQLLQRHKLLRLCIVPGSSKNELTFYENKPLMYDFQVSDRVDWLKYLEEEAAKTFTAYQPLFRFRLLRSKRLARLTDLTYNEKDASRIEKPNGNKSNSAFDFSTSFLYITHHSVMDGGYAMWLFQEHMHMIDAAINGVKSDMRIELPVLEPLETMFNVPDETESDNKKTSSETIVEKDYPQCSLRFHPNVTHCRLLEDYNIKFADEIAELSINKPSSGCLTFRLSKESTRRFIQRSKSRDCSPKSTLYSASLFALVDLIYEDRAIDDLEIPNEFMLDLRRCQLAVPLPDDTPHYPGLASLHIPLAARLSRSTSSPHSADFWNFVKTADTYLNQTKLLEHSVLQWLQTLVKHDHPVHTGKSVYPLCVSNLGIIDGVLSGDITDRVRLTDLNGHSTVLNDDMPLFFLTTLVLNGELSGNVCFCKTYTSYNTAEKYIANLKKYLLAESKL